MMECGALLRHLIVLERGMARWCWRRCSTLRVVGLMWINANAPVYGIGRFHTPGQVATHGAGCHMQLQCVPHIGG